MKQLFIMLLIASSAITTASAQQKTKPERVINTFETLIDLYGQKTGQTYSVEKNPNTGIIESSERIVSFTCKKTEILIEMIGDDFMSDEPLSYQIKHISPGANSQNFTLAVHTNVPNVINHYAIRTKPIEEMWFMACKNPDNPSLRDAYAIVWQPTPDNKIKGAIYMITSPRPSSINKAFGSFEPTENKSNIDNVVGKVVDETGNHAGVVVEEADTVAVIDDEMAGDTVTIIDHVEMLPDENPYGAQAIPVAPQATTTNGVPVVVPQPRQSSNWEPSPMVKMQVEGKAMAIKAQMDAIKATYQSIKPFFDAKNISGTDKIFEQIAKQNKSLDVKWQDFVKMLKGIEAPPAEQGKKMGMIGDIYKEILKFYTEQNQGFSEILKEFGMLPKGAQKTQKVLNNLIEKNMTEMSKVIAGVK
jgi:hypothetical protein